jgi:hypothetical protein
MSPSARTDRCALPVPLSGVEPDPRDFRHGIRLWVPRTRALPLSYKGLGCGSGGLTRAPRDF